MAVILGSGEHRYRVVDNWRSYRVAGSSPTSSPSQSTARIASTSSWARSMVESTITVGFHRLPQQNTYASNVLAVKWGGQISDGVDPRSEPKSSRDRNGQSSWRGDYRLSWMPTGLVGLEPPQAYDKIAERLRADDPRNAGPALIPLAASEVWEQPRKGPFGRLWRLRTRAADHRGCSVRVHSSQCRSARRWPRTTKTRFRRSIVWSVTCDRSTLASFVYMPKLRIAIVPPMCDTSGRPSTGTSKAFWFPEDAW